MRKWIELEVQDLPKIQFRCRTCGMQAPAVNTDSKLQFCHCGHPFAEIKGFGVASSINASLDQLKAESDKKFETIAFVEPPARSRRDSVEDIS